MQSQLSCSELMNNTVTYQITIQPWQIAEICTLRLTRARYNKHGRQLWETVRQLEASPFLITQHLHELVDQVLEMEGNWRAGLTPITRPPGALMSDPRDTLGGDSSE